MCLISGDEDDPAGCRCPIGVCTETWGMEHSCSSLQPAHCIIGRSTGGTFFLEQQLHTFS
jgi:hypothetical protein